jgi:hypothetical protein
MNERIGELYTEALKYADSRVPAERRYNDIYYAIVSGKHADLIVKECADIAAGERSGWEARNAIETTFRS